MKKKRGVFFGNMLAVLLLLVITGCDQTIPNGNGNSNNTPVAFQSAVQIGGISDTADSTALTLTFNVDPTTLTAEDITVTGATKGTLTGNGTTRTLNISNITVADSENLSVAITSPAGFTISGSPKTAVVYKEIITVTFQSAVQTGGTTGTADSTALTLTFDVDPDSLTADDITVTGATKGTLTGSGTTRTLNISNITVADSETISVAITNPSGFTISGSPQTVAVYKLLTVGMNYKGGKIAYKLTPSDPGHSYTQAHGIIAATVDQSDGIVWISGGNTQNTATGGTEGGLREGYDNTNQIIAQAETAGNTVLSTYAAGVCDLYTNTETGTGVFSDWYLPSRDELTKLYLNKATIGGFGNEPYWSSSESGDNPPLINVKNFTDGDGFFSNKGNTHRVRAIRDF